MLVARKNRIRSMKKMAPILIVLILLAIAIIAFSSRYLTTTSSSPSPSPSPSPTKVQLTKLSPLKVAPDFNLVDLDGVQHKLTDYRGKPVIINFWATWCPPCREELPSMNRAWQKVKDEGIAMIAINVGESEEDIFVFNGDYPIDFTVLLDTSSEVIETWGVKGLPTTFVLNSKGELVYRAVGGRAWDTDTILDKVRSLQAK